MDILARLAGAPPLPAPPPPPGGGACGAPGLPALASPARLGPPLQGNKQQARGAEPAGGGARRAPAACAGQAASRAGAVVGLPGRAGRAPPAWVATPGKVASTRGTAAPPSAYNSCTACARRRPAGRRTARVASGAHLCALRQAGTIAGAAQGPALACLVAVKDRDAQLREEGGDGALAHPHAAGEAQDEGRLPLLHACGVYLTSMIAVSMIAATRWVGMYTLAGRAYKAHVGRACWSKPALPRAPHQNVGRAFSFVHPRHCR